jgi:hemerythrin superfamily protein
MLDEHVRIVEAVRGLVRAATEENQPGFSRLAQTLVAHAEEEEEILYPAALLVARVLAERVGKR